MIKMRGMIIKMHTKRILFLEELDCDLYFAKGEIEYVVEKITRIRGSTLTYFQYPKWERPRR